MEKVHPQSNSWIHGVIPLKVYGIILSSDLVLADLEVPLGRPDPEYL
jgi:hypothetical protein